MSDQPTNKKPWYSRFENIGGILTGISTVLTLFAPNTFAYKAGIGIGAVMGIFGLRKGYQADNLYPGISDKLDKIPNSITGVRGSAKK